MNAFKYKAISLDGEAVTGVVEAYDEFEAVEKIKQTCSIVEKITQVEQGISDGVNISKQKVKEKDLAVACSQFAIIISSGLPIIRAVRLIADQTTNKILKKILLQVADDVSAGYGLAQSFELRGKKLPATFIETIRAGEESGTLDKAFEELHTYYDKSSKTKSKLISAITYPAFTIVVAVAVIIVIMVVAVPVFTKTFSSMGVDLPLPTRILIGVSGFTTKYGLFVLGIIALIIIAMKIISKTEKGKLSFARFRLKIPVIGPLISKRCAALYASTMATMMTAGLPMVRAVNITSKVLSNYEFATELGKAAVGIEEGNRLGDSMRKSKCFPELLTEMTSVGEETGTMEGTLRVLGDFYNNEVEVASSRALSLLEPIIICVLAVFVVFVLLSVYLPMFSLYGSI